VTGSYVSQDEAVGAVDVEGLRLGRRRRASRRVPHCPAPGHARRNARASQLQWAGRLNCAGPRSYAPWPMPMLPCSCSMCRSAKTSRTRPLPLTWYRRPLRHVTMPAASCDAARNLSPVAWNVSVVYFSRIQLVEAPTWPRCCSMLSDSYTSGAARASLAARSRATMPHILAAGVSVALRDHADGQWLSQLHWRRRCQPRSIHVSGISTFASDSPTYSTEERQQRRVPSPSGRRTLPSEQRRDGRAARRGDCAASSTRVHIETL